MFKFNLLNNFLVLLVLINSLDFSQCLSDKRLCADAKCRKIISLGSGEITYTAGETGMVSFKIGSQIRVFSKSAGSDPSLWGVEVNGRFGYVPKRLVRENKIYVKDDDLTFIVPVSDNGNGNDEDKKPVSESIPFVTDTLTPTNPLEEKLNANANANANENATVVEPLKMEVTETISPSSIEPTHNDISLNQTNPSNLDFKPSEDINSKTIKSQQDEKNNLIDIDYEEKDIDDNPDNNNDDEDDDDDDDDDEDDFEFSPITQNQKTKMILESIDSKKEVPVPVSVEGNQISLNSTENLPKDIDTKSKETLSLTPDNKPKEEPVLENQKDIKDSLGNETAGATLPQTLFIENSTIETLDSQAQPLVNNSETIVSERSEIVQNNEKINDKEKNPKETLVESLQNTKTIDEHIPILTKNDSSSDGQLNVESSAKVLDSIPISQENQTTNSYEKENKIPLEIEPNKGEVKDSKQIPDDNQNINAAYSNEQQSVRLKLFEDKDVNETVPNTKESQSTVLIQDSNATENNSSKYEATLLKEIVNDSIEKMPNEGVAESLNDINENQQQIETLGAGIALEKDSLNDLDKSLPLNRKDPLIPQQQLEFPTTENSNIVPTTNVNIPKADFQNEQSPTSESPSANLNKPQNDFKMPSETNFDNVIESKSSESPHKTDTLSSNEAIQNISSLPSPDTLTAIPAEHVNIPPVDTIHHNVNQIPNDPSVSMPALAPASAPSPAPVSAPSPSPAIPLESPNLTSTDSIKYDANMNSYDEIQKNVNNMEQQQVFEYKKGTTDDILKQKHSTNVFDEDHLNIDKTNPNINSDFVSDFSQSTTDFYSDNYYTEMPPNAFFDSLTESSLSNSLKDEEKRKEKHPKPSPSNIYKSEEFKKHGLFANILETVKNFIPNDNKLSEYIGGKMENRYCSSNSAPEIFTFDGFMNAFANKILEMADLVSLLGIVAGSLICFLIGYYVFCNSNRESNLIAKLNLLERSMLATNKENSILKHDLITTRNKLLSIEDSSFGSNDMVISLKQNLDEKTAEIERLTEQVSILEKELETATEAGLELNKMVSEMLNNQSGEDTIINSVEELQHQLNEQERTILEINTNLAAKSRENSELQLQIVEQKAQLGHQITVLQNDNDELESEKSVLETRLAELKSEFDQDITKALEGKNMEIRRLQSEHTAMQQRLEDLSNQLQTSEAKVKTFEECIQNLTKDSKENVDDVIDFANVKSQLLDMQNKYSSLKDSSQNQKEKLTVYEGQIQTLSTDLEQVKEQFHQSEKDKLEAQTRLEVLSSYFKEKEAQLQKELSQKESMWFKQQGEAVSTVERLTSMQDEIQSLKSQNDALRAEIEAQVAAHKAQIGTLENRAHETWLSARQADRRCEEAKAEAASLRHKLTALTSIPPDNPLNMGLPDSSSNSDMKMMPPLGVEPPGSPVLFPLPQFLPPHFMGPPPPGFMSLPPFMTPGDIRPAPLGRIMSPLPQHPNTSSRYSDYEADYLPYDDDMDDDIDNPLRHSRYSPPRTYRSHSPSDSRYDFDISLDCLSNPYDTETNVSPPPSPRRGRSWRSDDYDRHSPPPSISSAKYERRKNTNSLKKNSSKNDR